MIWRSIFSADPEGKDKASSIPLEKPSRAPSEGEPKGLSGEGRRFLAPVGDGNAVLSLRIDLKVLDESQIGRAALLLAATLSPEDEAAVKEQIHLVGWRAVATEIGGLAGDLPPKITRSVVGAALNGGVVEKKPNEMHALMHAAMEAMNAFMSPSLLEVSIGAKLAIVRNGRWLSVAVMGDAAYHASAHHERCGVGIMHI